MKMIYLIFCLFFMCLSTQLSSMSPIRDIDLVKVMTFNIRVAYAGGDTNARHWEKRKNYVENILNGTVQETQSLQGIDFVGLQEANWPWLTVFEQAMEGHHSTGSKGDLGYVNFGESVKLYYRADRWELDDFGVFEIGKDQWGRRIMGWAHFQDNCMPGRGIYILNSHWPVHGNIDGESVTNWISKRRHLCDPVVIMGDFNNAASTFSFFNQPGRQVKLTSVHEKLMADKGIDVKKLGTIHHFSNNWYSGRIDHIFVSDLDMPNIRHHLAIERAEIIHYPSATSGDGRAFASDHFPVVGVLRFDPN